MIAHVAHGRVHVAHARLHLGHFAHTGRSHRHEVRNERLDRSLHSGGVGTDHVWKRMPHLIHCVMGHMTMERPVARIVSDKVNGSRLAHRNENSRLRPSSAWRNHPTISLHHPKRMPVQMNRMV